MLTPHFLLILCCPNYCLVFNKLLRWQVIGLVTHYKGFQLSFPTLVIQLKVKKLTQPLNQPFFYLWGRDMTHSTAHHCTSLGTNPPLSIAIGQSFPLLTHPYVSCMTIIQLCPTHSSLIGFCDMNMY